MLGKTKAYNTHSTLINETEKWRLYFIDCQQLQSSIITILQGLFPMERVVLNSHVYTVDSTCPKIIQIHDYSKVLPNGILF